MTEPPFDVLPFHTVSFDRAAHLRRDVSFVERAKADPMTRVLVIASATHVPLEVDGALAWRSTDEGLDEAVLLGLDDEGRALFAVDGGNEEHARHASLRDVVMTLPDPEVAASLRAVALIGWHRRHRFCASCGAPTYLADAGHVRRCGACGTSHFPRTDPAVIMLVQDGDSCVLGRRGGAPEGRFSTLAGFVEPGESLEAAVAREVFEESGIEIHALRYHGSQPWPFPASLMLAFEADATHAPLRPSDEHAEVRWFSRSELAEALQQGSVSLPGTISAGAFLIRRWLGQGLSS